MVRKRGSKRGAKLVGDYADGLSVRETDSSYAPYSVYFCVGGNEREAGAFRTRAGAEACLAAMRYALRFASLDVEYGRH